MIIAGIDPGSYTTGYSFIESSSKSLRVLEYGAIRLPKEAPLQERVFQIYSQLEKLLAEYQPAALALETSFVAKFPQAALVLGHARGAIMVACLSQKIPFYEYEPRLIKKSVVGIGRASKDQIALMVQRHFGLKNLPSPADAADAIAIAYCHWLQGRSFINRKT